MKTQEVKSELFINGRKALVGHQFLEDIIGQIPDIEENKEIFSILAKSDNPNIREFISRKDNLSKKTIHLLLGDESQEVVDNILSSWNSGKKINEDALLKIIKSDNVKHLTTIAENIDKYTLCNICKVSRILSSHPNTNVRFGLVRFTISDAVTTKIIKKLSIDKDIDVAKEARVELSRRQ